jgi:hypothetical protein
MRQTRRLSSPARLYSCTPPPASRTLKARGVTKGDAMNVETRLARLESQNRWLRGGLAVAMLVATLPWHMAAWIGPREDTFGSVTTRSLTIIDEHGKPRGSWWVSDKDGNFVGSDVVRLELYGSDHTVYINPTEQEAADQERSEANTLALSASLGGSMVSAKNGEYRATRDSKVIWHSPSRQKDAR